FGSESECLALAIPAKCAHRLSVGPARKNQGIIVDPNQLDRAIGVPDSHHRLARMTCNLRDTGLVAREYLWLTPHGTIFAVEGPKNELLGPGRRKEISIRCPAQRAHPRRIARHAHVFAVGQPPAVEHRLLHAGDEKFSIGADRDPEVRALPLKPLRLCIRIGKPKCRAVIMSDGETEALR